MTQVLSLARRSHDRGARHRRVALVSLATVAALMAAPQASFASVGILDDDSDSVNGTVYSIAQVGDLTVIAGTFTTVGGQPRLNVAALGPDGQVDPDFNPSVNGTVRAVAASADGSRVFLGGVFTDVGGTARANLAAVDTATGAVVPTWQADTVGTAPDVLALTVAGDSLVVGGRFTGIDGAKRRLLAAVDTELGEVKSAFRPTPDAVVKSLTSSPDGSKVYVGGSFTTIGGQTRLHSVAEVATDSGLATAFAPTQGGGRVVAIGLSPNGSTFYFGTENNTVFAYNLSGNTPSWFVKMSGNTQAIAVSPTEVYLGGHFSQSVTEKEPRNLAASLDPVTGRLTTWHPILDGVNKGVWAFAFTPTHVVMGGGITTVGGVRQRGVARFAGTP